MVYHYIEFNCIKRAKTVTKKGMYSIKGKVYICAQVISKQGIFSMPKPRKDQNMKYTSDTHDEHDLSITTQAD
jgi:hypothetical protein